MKETTLATVEAPDTPKAKGFKAGIVLWDDVVVEAAPRRMCEWTRARVRNYCEGKGWTVTVVHGARRDLRDRVDRRASQRMASYPGGAVVMIPAFNALNQYFPPSTKRRQ